MDNKPKTYILITETTPVPIYEEPIKYSEEDFKKILKEGLLTPMNLNKQETLPCYITQKISEETFGILNQMATIEHERFGERTYKINNIKFEILTEEDYKTRYGNESL